MTRSAPEPVQNIYRVLCNEPYCYRPHEVDLLTPFQVSELILCAKDKKGMVVLDPPIDDSDPTPDLVTDEDWVREKWKLKGLSGWALEQVVQDELSSADEIEKEKRKFKLVKNNGH